jgi:hypothetical protein
MSGAQILSPRPEHKLLIEGWDHPIVEAYEQDGGRIMFVVDHRMGFEVSAADFEETARLIGCVYAVAIGMGCWPSGDVSDEERQRMFAHTVVPPTLWPKRCVEIAGFETAMVEPNDDDPRRTSE